MKEGENTGGNWRRRLLWQLPLFTLVCYLVSVSSSNFNEEMEKFMPETITNCSTYNGQASGYRALFELCQKVGIDCRRFEIPYRDLGSRKAVLFVVAPNYPMSNFETDEVLKWVAGGNDLIYLDYCMYGSGKHLLERLGLKTNAGGSAEDETVKPPEQIPEMQHVSQLLVSSETRLTGGRKIFGDQFGALLVEVKHRDGRCIIGTLPNLCANRRLSKKESRGNFQFLVNLLESQHCPVLFDERVHGYTASQNIFVYLARGPVGLITAQLLLIFALALTSMNQRFGPTRLVQVKRKIAASEFIDGMALTYQKARAYDPAFSILYGSFRTRLCKALSLSPQDNIETVAEAWSQGTSLSPEETLRFLKRAEELLGQRHINQERLLSIMKECDRLFAQSKEHLAVRHGRRLGV